MESMNDFIKGNRIKHRLNLPGWLAFIKKDMVQHIPVFRLLGDLLSELANAALRIDDPRLNAIMCRLGLYEIAVPDSEAYDEAQVSQIIDRGYRSAPNGMVSVMLNMASLPKDGDRVRYHLWSDDTWNIGTFNRDKGVFMPDDAIIVNGSGQGSGIPCILCDQWHYPNVKG